MKLKLIAIFSFAIFTLVFLTFKTETVSSQTQTETAGQKFKSIKVLNDMPADQMGKVMNMMSSSLGVDCKFCHASNDGDYEKEGFEHKDAARAMLKMTFEINKNFFNGRPEINCNSCHNGKSHPQPSFPLTPVPAAEPRPKQPDVKPTIDEILAKYEMALGGKNLAKMNSRYIKAQRIEPNGKSVEPEEIWTKGNKSAISTAYGDYVIKEIFDGTNAWKVGNGKPIELKADEAENIKREAQIFGNPNLKAIYTKMEVRFFDKLDGREVWIVQATTADNKRERLVFDATTGLLVRRSASAPTVLGNYVFQVDYADYKDFGEVKLPTVIKYGMPQIYWTRKVLEVKNNANVDDKIFIK